MKSYLSRKSWFLVIALLSCSPAVFSQVSGPPPVDRRTNPDRARQQDMSKREWQLRNFGNEPGRPKDQRQLAALMAQTEEDFNRILTLHNKIARALSSEQALDYHFVSEAAKEINKRASRLQSTLLLRQPPSEAEATNESEEFNDAQMKPALIKLCKQIRSFVTNPVIETPNTVNAEQLKTARRDLENLIQLSRQIKKDASKLSKPRN
jgi:hypothetical protein